MDWYGLHEVPSANTQKWISALAGTEDPFVAVCQALPDPHKEEWLLLACALHQAIGLQALSELLARVIHQLGVDALVRLPVVRESTLCDLLGHEKLDRNWELATQFPGIFWSVGRFLRNRGKPFHLWLNETAPRDIWRACGEIHFMGRSSSVRPKVLAFLHRLQAPSPAGLGIPLKNEGGTPPLPASGGARRWLAWIGPWESSGYSNASPARKQQILDGLYRRLNPESPWLACHSLQFFTEAASNSYYCSRIVGGCAQCHLAADCPRRLS